MRGLCISNLAWQPAEDEPVAERMRAHGFSAVELAPTKYWPRPLEADPVAVDGVRKFWEGRQLPVVALQSLLFGRADLRILQRTEDAAAALDHLAGIFSLARRLGARALVFGSPKNRTSAGLAPPEAWRRAIDFFSRAAESAYAHGCILCLEPNPPAYGCDFVTDSETGRRLVRDVNHPGFALHLDAAGMTLAGEGPGALVAALAAPGLAHFHISEPDLGPVGSGPVQCDHPGFAAALHAGNYAHWVSLEMRGGAGDNLPNVTRALEYAARIYGPRRCA